MAMKYTVIQTDLLKHVRCQFGWHGGMGDPPDAATILAVVRGTIEFMRIRPTWSPKEEKKLVE